MTKDDWVYVHHMLDQADKAIAHVTGVDRAEYDANELLRLALTHLVQTIGEAARRISPPFRVQHSLVPWKTIVGMRHKLVHDYMHVDYDIVWNVAMNNLLPLRTVLAEIIQEHDAANEYANIARGNPLKAFRRRKRRRPK